MTPSWSNLKLANLKIKFCSLRAKSTFIWNPIRFHRLVAFLTAEQQQKENKNYQPNMKIRMKMNELDT